MLNVVIVGRPNVGKSSLFNRIIRERKAVVEEVSGVTRDRLLKRTEWGGKSFYLTDTGGYVPSRNDRITSLVAKQVALAVDKGDVILFTVDGMEGITPLDKEIARELRKNEKQVILVVNKIDNAKREKNTYDFYKLGFEKVFPVSGIHSRGVGDLLDEVVKYIHQRISFEESKRIRMAIVGKPNVGKSSFFNKIIEEERVIVDETPGTTRDAVDTDIEFEDEKLTLIDTAGIKRKQKMKTDVEYYTFKRAINALLDCDVALVMVDGSVDITRQDKRIISLAYRAAGGVLILLNKMDLVQKEMWNEVMQYFHHELRYIPDILLLPISAKRGDSVFDSIRIAVDTYKRSSTLFSKKMLRKVIGDAVSELPPKRLGKKRVHVYGSKQVSKNPPCIVVYSNFPGHISSEYRKYLEKNIRKQFLLLGIPLVLKFKTKKKKSLLKRGEKIG
jgi:GTP-binding protein